MGVLVLSQYVEVGLAMQLLADSAEGVGYLLKDRVSEVKEFIAALRRVADGGSALDPTIVSTMLKRHRSSDPLDSLTPRTRGLGADGHRSLQCGHCRVDGDHAARGREIRVDDLHQARYSRHRKRIPTGAGRPALPSEPDSLAYRPPHCDEGRIQHGVVRVWGP